MLCKMLMQPDAEIEPEWQGPNFYRPLVYIRMAIAGTYGEEEDLERVAGEYLRYLEGIRKGKGVEGGTDV